jgi:ankyrin repeat protein
MNALRDAVKSGDAGSVSAMLAGRPDLRARIDEGDPSHDFGATLLNLAVERNDRATVDALLRGGADIDARSNWWAGSFGVLDLCPPELAPYLIERGATVDAHAVARLGMVERLRAILDRDPDAVRARGGDGQTPLHFASTVEIADLLLDRDAEANALDIDHESTPAQWMAKDRVAVARRLVERGAAADLLLAAALGDLDRVREHLDRAPASIRMSVSAEWFPMRDPRAGGKIYIWTLGWNKTAHMVARERGHDAVYRMLMERSPAELAVAVACLVGDDAAVERVVVDGEARRIADAAQANDAAAVGRFLRAGWPVDARGQHRMTPLQWAAFHGNLEMVRLLIEAGADVRLAGNDFGGNALGAAEYGAKHGWYRETGDYEGVIAALRRG